MGKLKKYYKKYWKQEPNSAVDFFLYKATCSLICAGYTLKYFNKLSITRRTLLERSIKNTREKRSAFVFANGPSLGDIDLRKIAALQNNGGHDVIALNSFFSKSGGKIKPDYAIFADSVHFQPDGENIQLHDQYVADIEYCRANNVTTLVPAEYYDSIDLDTKLAFCTIANIYGKNTRSICSPVGFFRLTALYALVLAKELGYHRIYIAGFDNSYFKDFEITHKGECRLRHVHYYDDSVTNTAVTPLVDSTVAIFYDFYKHFYFIDKIVKGDPRIVNIAKKTYINTIPINVTLDVYKES